MKKVLAMLLCAMMVASMMAGCTSQKETETTSTTTEETTEAASEESTEEAAEETASAEITAPEKDVEMQYISVEDATKVLDSDDYTFLDVRKAEDYNTSHVPGAVGADMDAAKNGDFDAGIATMQEATKDVDNNLVVICYTGKSYAQATTNVLSALGYDMSKVYTLEGGFKAWTEAQPENVEVSAEITAPESDVEMQYMSVEDASTHLGEEGYTFLDVRKAEDYNTSHIPGAVGADMDAAKSGDFNAGVSTMQVATRDLDDTLVVICYTGKSYAQATTNVLSALGYDMSKVYTLEGGFEAWTEAYPDNVE